MANSSRPFTKSSARSPATEQQSSIAQQTAEFLQRGGKIQHVERGVSGQPKLGGPQAKPAQPAPAATQEEG